MAKLSGWFPGDRMHLSRHAKWKGGIYSNVGKATVSAG